MMNSYPKEMIEDFNRVSQKALESVETALARCDKVGEKIAVGILQAENIVLISDTNADLMILQILRKAVEKEMEEGLQTTAFTGRNVSQLLTLYQKLVFLLRRIEFGLPQELCAELIPFMIQEQISDIVLLTVIQENYLLFHKSEILQKVQSLLDSMEDA